MNRLRQRLFVRALEDRTAPATFTVTNLADSGANSLRDCVSKANAAAGFDTVTFDSGLAGTITLASEITVTEQVNFAGTGKVTLSGGGAVNIFHINQVAKAALVLISDTTFSNGFYAGNGGAIFGGDEHLEVVRCTFRDNKSANSGGAISLGSGGMVTATDSRFTGNSASSSGGAVFVLGAGARLNLTGCTVSGNTAGLAGALYSRSSVQIDNSTVSGNIATDAVFGGALVTNSFSAADTQRIRNSTFSGNSTAGNGGAVYIAGSFPGTFTVQNSTFTANTAAGIGGAIARGIGTATIALESSIVSGNAGSAPDISSAGTVTMKTSAVGSGTGFSKTDLGGNLSFGINLKLGPLADNGGPTLTHLPAGDSPLIDVGSNPVPLLLDQRGAGFPRVIGGLNDIGAVEAVNLVVQNVADSGLGSLRQTIAHANTHPGADIITFDPAVFATPQTITMLGTEMAITDSVTITGPAAALTINAGAKSRHFNTTVAPLNTPVTLNGLKLTGGVASGPGGAVFGGNEHLILNSCVLNGNKVTDFSPYGGAVFMGLNGKVSANNSSFTNNVAGDFNGWGGAIVAFDLVLQSCTVSGNYAGEDGGGIYIPSGAIAVTIEGSTIANNYAYYLGGGIAIRGGAAPVTHVIRNSTISSNIALDTGGGIYLQKNSVSLEINNCTITANYSDASGGGIFVSGSSGTLSLSSTIVAQNNSPDRPDLSFSPGVIVPANNCIVGVVVPTNVTLSGTGNFSGTSSNPLDAKLGPLATNGGPTMTHALLPGSPALNSGGNPAGLTNDQRGSGFARTMGQTDIGAFELQIAPAKVTNVQIDDGSAQRSRVTSLLVTFDQMLVFIGSTASGFQLKRQSDNALVTLNAVPAGNTVTLTFTGGPVEFGSLADGRYTLTALASMIANLDGDGNGTIGDDFVLASADSPNPPTNIFRLFGDADGDGTVANNDFNLFRSSFGGTDAMFDFDGDGTVAISDFNKFRGQFGGSI